MNLFTLKNQIAMVTGASRGLGRAMAIGMAGADAHIVAVGRDDQSLAETEKEISAVVSQRRQFLDAASGIE